MNIFLDDGGVLSDNSKRPEQVVRLLGEFLPSRIGGTAPQWGTANMAVIRDVAARHPHVYGQESQGDVDWWADYEAYQIDWLRSMANHAAIALPVSDAECLALSKEAHIYFTSRWQAAADGASQAVRELFEAGHVLYTSSGTVSQDLEGTLRAQGIRQYFKMLCTPDNLGGIGKGDPRFVAAVFAHAGVDPYDALILDDGAYVLRRAKALGARTVLVSQDAAPQPGIDYVIAALAELPALMPKLG